MSDDFLDRARMALQDMHGRVEAGKLMMFLRTIEHAETLEARAEKAEAERDALREALRRLLSSPAISDGDQADPEWGCSETYAAEINARAALKRKKSDE